MAIHSVILAGGQGTRFWPVSRVSLPKQFLSITHDQKSLIRATADRAIQVSTKDNLWVVSTSPLHKLVSEHVPEAKIIVESVPRNTAASIGLAAIKIGSVDPNGVMIILPSDHAVKNEKYLISLLKEAAELAAKQPLLVTFGIRPTSPQTGYGYIRRGGAIHGFDNAFFVRRFFEKPNQERAQEYVQAGDFLWNSGMFAWSVSSILAAIEDELPLLHAGLQEIKNSLGTKQEEEVIARVFDGLESISIDFGVLEHVRNTAVIQADDFGWNDVGAWDAWAEYFQSDKAGNQIEGEVLMIESERCIVRSSGRLIAVLGLEDLVVIESQDATLICPRERVQDVRKVVDQLRACGKDKLL